MKRKCLFVTIVMGFLISTGCNYIYQTDAIMTESHTETPILDQTKIASEVTTQSSQTVNLTPKTTPVRATNTIIKTKTATLTEVPGKIITDPKLECQKVPIPEFDISPEPGVLLSGRFFLCEQWPISTNIPNDLALWGFDFDTGQVSGSYNLQNDLIYFIQWNNIQKIDVHNIMSTARSRLYITNDKITSYEDCKKLIDSKNREDGVVEAKYAKACFLTNEGRIAYMQVEAIDQYGWGSLNAFFITWEKK